MGQRSGKIGFGGDVGGGFLGKTGRRDMAGGLGGGKASFWLRISRLGCKILLHIK
jgi:hypothetical protein